MHRDTLTSGQRDTRLQAVIALSQQMIEQAGRGEWDDFAELEQRRRRDMLACFEVPVVAAEASRVRANIEQLMRLNDQITELLQQARAESARQFQMLQKGRSAVSAYRST